MALARATSGFEGLWVGTLGDLAYLYQGSFREALGPFGATG